MQNNFSFNCVSLHMTHLAKVAEPPTSFRLVIAQDQKISTIDPDPSIFSIRLHLQLMRRHVAMHFTFGLRLFIFLASIQSCCYFMNCYWVRRIERLLSLIYFNVIKRYIILLPFIKMNLYSDERPPPTYINADTGKVVMKNTEKIVLMA